MTKNRGFLQVHRPSKYGQSSKQCRLWKISPWKVNHTTTSRTNSRGSRKADCVYWTSCSCMIRANEPPPVNAWIMRISRSHRHVSRLCCKVRNFLLILIPNLPEKSNFYQKFSIFPFGNTCSLWSRHDANIPTSPQYAIIGQYTQQHSSAISFNEW